MLSLLHDTQHAFRLLSLIHDTQHALKLLYLCLLLHDNKYAFKLLYLCWLCCMIHNMHSDCCIYADSASYSQHAFRLLYLCWLCCMTHNMHSNCCIYAESHAWYTTCIQIDVSMLTLLHDTYTCIQTTDTVVWMHVYVCWLCYMIHNMHSDCCICKSVAFTQ